MLHAEVRSLDEFVTVLVPRVRTEPVLEACEHGFRLRELLPGLVQVVRERPEVERQSAGLALVRIAEVSVLAGVDLDIIVVDWILDEPVVRRRVIGVARGLPQTAVGNVDDRIRYGYGDAQTVRLVGLEILVGPPHARAQSLARGRDPRVACTVVRPYETTVPRRALRDARPAVVEHRHRFAMADRLRRYERHEECVPVTPISDLVAILHHAVDFHGDLKIDLHFARRLHDAVRDAVVTADRAVGWIDLHVKVVERRVPPCAPGRVAAAQRIGMGEHTRSVLLSSNGHDRSDCNDAHYESGCTEKSDLSHVLSCEGNGSGERGPAGTGYRIQSYALTGRPPRQDLLQIVRPSPT